MVEGGGQKRSILVKPDNDIEFNRFNPQTNPGGDNVATIRIPVARFNGLTITSASWKVLYIDQSHLLTASQADAAKVGLGAAKARTDADLYGSFSFLTGVGTSPIWMIDMKAGYGDTLQHLFHPHSTSSGCQQSCKLESIHTGLLIDLQTNTDTKAPVDRTEIDPDSIRAFWKFFGTSKVGQNLYSLYWELQPAAGEFDRSNPSSNFIGGGKLKLDIVPPLSREQTKKIGMDFDPQIALEIGRNLNKPSVLFKRPVDLSSYDTIRRLVPGADADFYFFRMETKDPGDPYLLTLSGSWAARIPFSPEPFTVSELVLNPATGTSTRQKVVRMRENTRHNVRVDLNWNATKLLAFQIGYRYGSLPPLFQLVNHQVTIGLVFKAKFLNSHSVTP